MMPMNVYMQNDNLVSSVLLSAPLRSFLAVAELGSVSRAARQLGLTQPAVTKQLRVLEGALHCPLVIDPAIGSDPTEGWTWSG